ncbi:beta-glucosidase BglX [Caldibacillus lycopersici]|uniref:beta-glucosidase n=1 Tax=Perspicuibacillus lycopersici TaxID=1325689 RepID=A0AAE3LLR7_9BACI|nr:beta-glucosidase BglX [Perspicuibacillus lycopersici]MCU9612670.1 beta-glucosidase BglX [Perspicuibacillus lycopersici]
MEQKALLNLLKEMTLDEKIDQLQQLATHFFKGASEEGEITGPITEMGITEDVVLNTGSVLGASGATLTRNLQEAHLKENRLGIPLLFMADVIHGFKTIFPVPLAIGSSWDLELAEKSAEIAAKESAVSGVHVTFAPMVDLVRDPRWGRVMESTGEDPYLNSEYARAFVRGFQGNDLTNDKNHIAACVKHFAAYGAPEGGRDYNTVNMSERQLRELYLPSYKAALDEGCEMVMTAFNTVDGIPPSGNEYLMRDILRQEWGFNGVVISDWGAVKELIPHGVAQDEKEAAIKALRAGVDIEMMTTCYVHHVKSLILEGKLEESLLDESVLRILELKNKLGLFEDPYRGSSEALEKEVILSESHRKVARELATKSCVLLKNENILPLNSNQKIALIGPFAQSGDLMGPWSWHGAKEDVITVEMGIQNKVTEEKLLVAKGSDVLTIAEEQLQQAVETSKHADVIVLALGESSYMSGEGGSRADIRIPEAQLTLLNELKQLNKPIVTILFNGRPLDLHGVVEQSNAILEAWYPGTEGGAAIADLLFGDANPSGKLTMSFPYSVGQVPVYYNCYNTGRPFSKDDPDNRYVSKYIDIPNEPIFPFGFGLSYTTFEYSKHYISNNTLSADNPITVTVQVRNTGARAGEEIVQLYIRDITGEVVRPLKELKAFQKVALEANQTKTVSFTITEEQLRYYHRNLEFKSDNGLFEVYVGPNSSDVVAFTFTLV